MSLSEHDNRPPLFRFLWYHLPPILVGLTILSLSSIPHLHGPDIEAIGVDKIAHFTEYGIFGWFLARSVLRLAGRGGRKQILLLTLIFLVLFACGDEFLQSFIPGRDSSVFDVLADSCGAACALILTYRTTWRNQS